MAKQKTPTIDEFLLISGAYDGAVFVFKVSVGKEKDLSKIEVSPYMHMHDHVGTVISASYFPAKKLLVTGGSDMGIRVYNARTRKAVGFLNEHDGPVSALAFAESYLLSAGGDGKLCLYDTKEFEPLLTMKGHKQGVGSIKSDICSIVVHPSQKMAFSACTTDSSIRLWDLLEGSCVYSVKMTSATSQTPRRMLGMEMREGTMLLWDERSVTLHSMEREDIRIPNSIFDITAIQKDAIEQQASTTERISAAAFWRDSNHVLIGTNHGNIYSVVFTVVKEEGKSDAESEWKYQVLGSQRVSEGSAPSSSSSYVCRVKGIKELETRGNVSLVAVAMSDGEVSVCRVVLSGSKVLLTKLKSVYIQNRLTVFQAMSFE